MNNSGTTYITNAINVANSGTGLVSIGGTNTAANQANAWTGTMTLNRNVQFFGDTTPGSSGRSSFNGQITGVGGITITAGRVSLANSNSNNNFTGPVVVNSGATLQLDVQQGFNEQIPNASAVTVNGFLNFASGGGAETIGSLSGSGTISSAVPGIYSLIVGNSNSTTFSGLITDGSGSTISLTQNGTGTLTLSGTNTYTGTTTVTNGSLVISGLLGGGSYSAIITNNASLIFSNSGAQTLSGAISGSGSFTMAGAGTTTFTGTNTYTGLTTVNAGLLTNKP